MTYMKSSFYKYNGELTAVLATLYEALVEASITFWE